MPSLAMKHRGGLLLVELIFDGKPYDFIVDTGCDISTLTPHLIPEGYQTRVFRVEGQGGSTYEPMHEIKFNFVGVHIKQICAANDHLLKVGRSVCGDRFGGLIGTDVLSKFRSVEFNFAEQKITFTHFSTRSAYAANP